MHPMQRRHLGIMLWRNLFGTHVFAFVVKNKQKPVAFMRNIKNGEEAENITSFADY